MPIFTSKVTPAPQKKVQEKEERRNDGTDTKAPVEIFVMSLHEFSKELVDPTCEVKYLRR